MTALLCAWFEVQNSFRCLAFVEYLEVRVYLADAHVTSLVVLDQFEELAGQEEQSKQRWCLRILRMHP